MDRSRTRRSSRCRSSKGAFPSVAEESVDGDRTPEVAVVIPTRFRETRLAFVLEALADQSLEHSRFEVVVVRPADAVHVPLCEAPAGLNVRFLVSPVASPATQRNLGWRAARSPLIAFTDD